MPNRVDIQVGYSIDKSSLSELLKQLKNVQTIANQANLSGNIKDELKEAGEAAKELEQILNSSWNSKLGQLDLSKVNTGIKNAGKTAKDFETALVKSGAAGTAAYNSFASSVLNTQFQLKQTSKILDNMATTLKNTIRYGISSSIFNNLTNSIQKAYTYTKELDTSLNDIRIVTGQSAEEMDKFAVRANRVAKDLGRSTKDFTNAALIYYQQGLGNEEAQARAEVTMKAANVTGQSGREVSEQLTAVWNGYKVTADEAELYVDKLAAVAATTAADLEELSTGMSKVASAANLMGVDVDQLNAQLATIVSVTRQAPESVGTALKTIYARMSNIEAGLDDEVTLGNYTEKMAQMGFNVLAANGHLRDMGEVIEEIGNKWTSMSREQQVALSQTVAGTRQYNNLLSLFDNWDMYTDALKTSANAAGTLQEQQNIYMESTEAHLQKLSTEAERTYDILFDQKAVNGFADALTGALNIFNNFIEGLGGGAEAFTFFGATIANIFNKQIGTSIERQIENFESWQANMQAIDLKGNVADSVLGQQITEQHAIKGESISSEALKTEAILAKEILSVRQSLTDEQYNELTKIQQKIGLNETEIEYLSKYKDISIDILDNENATIEDYQERLSLEQESLDNEKEKLSYLTREKNLYQRGMRDDKDTEGFRQALSDLGQKDTTSLEQFKIIEEARMKIIDGETLSQKEIQTIIEAQNSALNTQQHFVDTIKQGLEGRQAQENGVTKELNRQTEAMKKWTQQQIDQANRQQAIQGTIQLLSTTVSLMTSISGIFKTINDDTLSFEEKVERIAPVLLGLLTTAIPMLISLPKTLGTIGVALKIIDAKIWENAIATKSWGAIAKVAFAEMLPILLAIGIAIAGVAAAVSYGTKAWNESANAEKAAKQEAEQLSVALTDCKNAAQELKDTISDYNNELAALDKLTKGTDEYKKALEKANEKAQELIDKYDLIAGRDYRIDENGLIHLDTSSGSGLANKQTALDTQVSKFNNQNLGAQIRAELAHQRTEQIALQRRGGVNYLSEQELAHTRNTMALTLLPGGGLISGGYTLARLTSEDRGYNLTEDVLKEISNAFSSDNNFSLLSDSNEALKNWIQNNENLSQAVKDNVNIIVEEKNAIASWIKSLEASEASIQKYSQQIGESYINNNATLTNGITSLIKDVNGSASKDLITQALLASRSGRAVTSASLSHMEYYKEVSDDIKSNDDLENFLKQYNLGAESLGLSGDIDDEAVVRAYLQNVLGFSTEDLTHLKIKTGWGNTSVTWDEAYTDSMGESHKAQDQIFNEKSLEELRRSSAYQYALKQNEKNMQDFAESMLQDDLTAIDNMYKSLQEFNANYGIDLGNIILNSMAGRDEDGKMAPLDFTGAFASLSDGQIDELIQLTPEGLRQALHMTEDDFTNLGYDSAEAFEKAFDEGLFEKERKALVDLLQNIDMFGTGANNLSNRQYNDLATTMSQNMSASQMQALSSRPLALSQIDFNTTDFDKVSEQLTFMAKCINQVNDAGVSLTDTQREQAKELGYSEKALQAYAEELENSNEALKDNDKAAADIALANVRMNKGIDTLAKNFEHWQAILKDNNKNSGEYYEVLSQLKDATENIFGVSVSNAFLENEENLARMKELAEGNVEAFDELQEAAIQDYIMHLDIVGTDEETVNEIRNSILNMVNDVNSQADIKIGTELDDSYVDQLNEMLAKGQITERQMNKILAGIGYSPTITYKKEKRTTETQHDVSADIFGQRVSVGTVWDRQTTFVDVPQIEGGSDSDKPGPTYVGRPSSSGINYSNNVGRRNNNGNGGGSKTKDPAHEKPVEEEADRYKEVNSELALISSQLQELDNKKKKLFGKDLIANLNKQIALTNKNIDATNKKLAIARDEEAKLRAKLQQTGVIFDEDGLITNYEQAFANRLKLYNDEIDRYNGLTAEQQEVEKETLDNAKKEWERWQKDVDKQIELWTKGIPDLQADVQKALDDNITKQIENFDIEIQLRLDTAQAERDWNNFNKTIIEKIKDNDIIGNANFSYANWQTYYKDNGNGTVQTRTDAVNKILADLYAMDAGGEGAIYGNDRAKAIEDLRTANDNLVKSLQEVDELEKEIYQSYIDMQNEAQEKFKEQIDTYEMIGELIDHDMKVIQLVYGEDSYSALAKYYDKQKENNNNQLDFQRQQVQFWENQMDSLDKGTEAWENARSKWQESVKDWKKLIETSIEDLQDRYTNAINEIFDRMNRKVTGGNSLEYVNEQWNLINKNAGQYLDNINALYETQSLENKYLDAIDNTDSLSAQKQLKKVMDEELAGLRERDRLTQYDIDRANKRYEIALKQIALEEAQQNKTSMRLRRDTQGNYRYEYVADNDQINQLTSELDQLYNSLYNFDKSRYVDNLNEIYNAWTEFQEKMKAAEQIRDPEERAAQELLIQEQYGELINGLVEQNLDIRANLQDSAFEDLSRLYDEDIEKYRNMSNEEVNILMNELVPQWGSGVQQMADNFAGNGGFIPTCKQGFKDLEQATKDYETELNTLQKQAGENFEKIRAGEDATITKTQTLITKNKELTTEYQNQFDKITNLIDNLEKLVGQYEAAEAAAKKATQEAYNYQMQLTNLSEAKQEFEKAKVVYNNPSDAPKTTNTPSTTTVSQSRPSSGPGNSRMNLTPSTSSTLHSHANAGANHTHKNLPTTTTSSQYDSPIGPVQLVTAPRVNYSGDNMLADQWNSTVAGTKMSRIEILQELTELKKKVPGLSWDSFATGGYTGEWGNSGRLAMLHQKELVLNEKDTENMLNAVTIMRDITSTLGTSIFSKLAGIAAAGTNGINTNGILDQNVSIQATFPNVTNSHEIESALNNLVNMAAMRVNQKGS